ncbi:MAG: hydrogenase expression/formation protein HypE [Candidatus Hodarchaeales archaeon]
MEKSLQFVELSHGAGGLKMDQMLEFISNRTSLRKVVSGTGNIGIDAYDDGAIISKDNFSERDLVISIDGHTVDPIFFPGGDIGKLSICGTLNDVLMMGAKPIAITSAIILEEGFSFNDLDKILKSMDKVCKDTNVPIIAGDTKVVPKGTLDKVMIVTTGIGKRISKEPILDSRTKLGDKIIVTGPVGSHGIALMSFREGIEFETSLISDVASLDSLLIPLLSKYPIHTMKDPTRGGFASAINEIAQKSNVTISINQVEIPIHPAVKAASELLGLEPLEITSEGQAIITISSDYAEDLLKDLKNHPQGKNATIIGEVIERKAGKVFLETEAGGKRRLQKPVGELIPRVC